MFFFFLGVCVGGEVVVVLLFGLFGFVFKRKQFRTENKRKETMKLVKEMFLSCHDMVA